ncbi:hypothetical protein C8R44DRAFT_727176 [Mycena epipterygia]|nr:hypothetical protein C8R44DRAFT_727176 [Mycena epipterygia]
MPLEPSPILCPSARMCCAVGGIWRTKLPTAYMVAATSVNTQMEYGMRSRTSSEKKAGCRLARGPWRRDRTANVRVPPPDTLCRLAAYTASAGHRCARRLAGTSGQACGEDIGDESWPLTRSYGASSSLVSHTTSSGVLVNEWYRAVVHRIECVERESTKEVHVRADHVLVPDVFKTIITALPNGGNACLSPSVSSSCVPQSDSPLLRVNAIPPFVRAGVPHHFGVPDHRGSTFQMCPARSEFHSLGGTPIPVTVLRNWPPNADTSTSTASTIPNPNPNSNPDVGPNSASKPQKSAS